MLKLLEKRADYLKDCKFEKAEKVESAIDAYKTKHYEALVTPTRCFVTF
jgi:hypothetical protein